MTRATLRETLYALLFETGRASVTDATANRFLNDAMHHVAAWIAANQLGYFIASWSGSVANAARLWMVPIDLSAVAYPTALRLLWAGRKRTGVERYEALRLIAPDDTDVFAGLYNESEGPNRPGATVMNHVPALVNAPVEPTTYSFFYIHGLRDMTVDADTPGQSGGVGDENKLPELFQPLIPLYAAITALAAENADTTPLRQMYEERRAQLAALTGTRLWKR